MKHNKKILPIRWLLFAILVTAMVSTVTLSRYVTEVSGTGTAQVAKFDVTAGTDSVTVPSFTLAPGESATWEFTVQSKSETAVTLKAQLEGTENLPLTYTVTEYKGFDIDGVQLNRNNAKAFDSLPAAETSRTYTLKVAWPANEKIYSSQIDAVRLVITAEQKS